MAAAYQQQLARICGKEETLRDAKDLLNVARSKTGPGSGHDLGKNANALPAICAFLTSERLGNNDVVKKVAQDVSCLKPKDFEAALSTVRGAVSGYLRRRRGKGISYHVLCHTHGLSQDALYWMEEVDKELRKSGALDDLDVDDEAVVYTVFYWTCIALNIRSVKQATIISDYRVPLHAFQDLEDVLEATCSNLKESMSKFVGETRTARSTLSTPAKSSGRSPTKLPRDTSPSKERAGTSLTPLSSPIKTPTKASAGLQAVGSASKRKTVLPPLPFMTPKKQKTTSPLKLNRLPVTSNFSTPSKSRTEAVPTRASPTKTYGSSKLFANSPVKSTPSAPIEELGAFPMHSEKLDVQVEPPSTPAKVRTGLRWAEEQSTPSPRKSARGQSAVAGSSTRTRRTSRCRLAADSDVEMEDIQTAASAVADTDSESSGDGDSGDGEIKTPPCRHYQPIFADRLFYHYRDPRVLREWVACENNIKAVVEQFEDPFDTLAVH